MYLPKEKEAHAMELNKGWKEGTIGIPQGRENYKVVHYYIRSYKRRSKLGIDGGKIVGLILNVKDETLGYYSGKKGWVIEPTSEEAEIALAILMLENK